MINGSEPGAVALTEEDAATILDIYSGMSITQRMDTNECLTALGAQSGIFYGVCRAAKDGDLELLSLLCGQIVGAVNNLKRSNPFKGMKSYAALCVAMGGSEPVKRFWSVVDKQRPVLT